MSAQPRWWSGCGRVRVPQALGEGVAEGDVARPARGAPRGRRARGVARSGRCGRSVTAPFSTLRRARSGALLLNLPLPARAGPGAGCVHRRASRQRPVDRLRPLGHQQLVHPGERPRPEEARAAPTAGSGARSPRSAVAPRAGARVCASRPHSTATSGPPRATSAAIAASVTASQPAPRCEAGAPGRTVRTRLSSMTPAVGPGRQVAGGRRRAADVGHELGEDVGERARHRAHVGPDREGQAHRVAGRRVGVLADDEHADVGERTSERPQHRGAGRQVRATGRDLGAQEVAHRADLRLDRRRGRRPSRGRRARAAGWVRGSSARG